MADSAYVPPRIAPAHSATVRTTHWITTVCFLALLVTGVEIIISHPRYYWGEEGNVNTPSLFDLPIPASRRAVVTGYNYVLPDQNGWSRSLHFQSAWLLVFTGLLYGIHGWRSRHFQNNLLPSAGQRSAQALSASISQHFRRKTASDSAPAHYNLLQKLTYLGVIFGLIPAMIWTGLAMSPGFTAAFPFIVDVLGGFQSARTLHFFITLALVAFVAIHVTMVCLAGFGSRMRSMITGHSVSSQEPT
jgi:thiosulfate reductase cytochrome b subunit